MRRKSFLSRVAQFDFIGLAGCVVLFMLTYGIFWYYAEILKGNQAAIDLTPKAASATYSPHHLFR